MIKKSRFSSRLKARYLSQQADRSKQLPFDIEHFLDVVGDASKRSRQFLLLLSFSTFLIFIAWQNSPVPRQGWHQARISLLSVVKEHLILKGDSTNESKALNLSEFIFKCEAKFSNQTLALQDSIFIFHLNENHPTEGRVYLRLYNFGESSKTTFSKRKERYKEIANSIDFVVQNKFYSRKEIDDYYDHLKDKEIDHFMIIKVPILGVSFDVRYLGFYGTAVILALYLLFYTSLKREYISLKTAFKRGWVGMDQHHYYFYEYMSMQQVFSIPPKLFVPKSENHLSKSSRLNISMVQSFVLSGAIWTPCGLCWWVALGSIFQNYSIFRLDFWMLLTLIFLAFVTVLTIFSFLYWKKMDYFWENQTYEFNFEYILECIGVDNEYDLRFFSENPLTEDNKSDVKVLWCHLCKKAIAKNGNSVSPRKSVKLLSQFIDDSLSKKFVKDHQYSNNDIDQYWEHLHGWFKTKGRKNIGSPFRSSFNIMVNELAKGQ